MLAGNGDNQPPRNMTDDMALIKIMFMYSARKNSAKLMPEYSIMCRPRFPIRLQSHRTARGWFPPDRQ